MTEYVGSPKGSTALLGPSTFQATVPVQGAVLPGKEKEVKVYVVLP